MPAALKIVEPTPPRGLRALILRLLAAPPSAALERSLPFRLIVWRAAPRLIGLVRRLLPFPAAVLQTRDLRNGRAHRRVVIYFHDGERVIVVPSRGGGPRDPFWLDNARADPHVLLARTPLRAQLVEDAAEQARLWQVAEAFYPAYATYREHAARCGRTIPLLQLHPRT